MAIKLRVISDHYQELGEQRSRVFGVNGGTIGRAPDNDWILPDAKRLVSGHHCEIEYRSGAYWLKDKSTNGVFVNESDDPVSETGPVALQDGDRLRLGDYEVLVSLDDRIDFLPGAAELHSAAKHLDADIGANFDLDSLFKPRESADSGSISIRNAFGLRVPRDLREAAATAVARAEGASPEDEREPPMPPPSLAAAAAPRAAADWALKTRAVTREELADALERRKTRIEARQQAQPFHQQAGSWADLKSSLQAFCRGAGIDPNALSPEAQAMLPLLAGQLLREAVVGLNDLQQARTTTGPAAASATRAQESPGSNPLRSSSSVEQALVRLFESHGRVYGGPVDALRDVLLEAKEHEAGLDAGMKAGLKALLEQLAPSNVADQFEQGRSRTLAPGQDPRPRYWEHYAELYRVVMQNAAEGVPHPFVEPFLRAYEETRSELAAKRRNRGEG
jgi:type VI secretion system FHA domain protein